MPARYRSSFVRLLPSWLTRDEGELVLYSLGVIGDAFLTRLYQGLFARFPEYAPESALGHHGRDRKIIRGRGESAAAYGARLKRWLDDHRRRGNPFARMDQLFAYLQADVVLRNVDHAGNWFTRAVDGTLSYVVAAGNWNWDGLPYQYWARFWPIIFTTSALWERDGTWNDGETWGQAGTGTWGSTATREEVDTVRSIVREWSAEHARALWIIISFSGSAFDPAQSAPPLPDGTWKHHSKNVGGTQVRARDDDGIYWNGITRAA